ncbi:MAG: purine-nucleoside phosphorylase [Bacteroidetes bacterium]|nr:purine-nucleoside phosphorylase [Bacteroidota bacterium]
MGSLLENIAEATDFLRSKVDLVPSIGVVLGTGLGELANEIKIVETIPYESIPHFPVSTVDSHEGQLIFGSLGGKIVVAMKGRFHYYEGYRMEEVVFPVRVMKHLGIEKLFLSGAAGGVNADMQQGDIMIMKDHINLQPSNPLRGVNHEELGPRFPDMSEPYDQKLIEKGLAIAKENDIRCSTGVYACLAGPNLETKAEYQYLNRIGADAVGMSTIPEVIAANHMGLNCFSASIITNVCYPPEKVREVTIEDVIAAARKSEPKMTLIIKELINSL